MKTMRSAVINLMPVSGLVVGPLAWAINTQLGDMLPALDCYSRTPWPLWTSVVAVLVSLAAGAGSFLAMRLTPRGENRALLAYGSSADFVARLSGYAGLLFAFGIGLQGAAGLVVSGCAQ